MTFAIFTIDGYVKTYGLLYVELLDKYGKGPKETGMVATLFGIVLTIACRFAKVEFNFQDLGICEIFLKYEIFTPHKYSLTKDWVEKSPISLVVLINLKISNLLIVYFKKSVILPKQPKFRSVM